MSERIFGDEEQFHVYVLDFIHGLILEMLGTTR